jgi:hypothetical protein
LPLFSAGGTLKTDFGELGLEMIDSTSNQSSIRFQLGFPCAHRTKSGTAWSTQMLPCSSKSWKGIFHSGEFNLETCLSGARSTSKNVENHLFTINHGHPRKFFPVALLSGADGLIENDHISFFLLCLDNNFIRLAGAQEKTGTWSGGLDQQSINDFDSQCVRELPEFLEKTE